MRLRHALLALVAIIAVVTLLVAAPAAGVRAQAGNGITSPADGAVVQGSVQIVGTATLPDFQRYALHFSANGQDWVYFGSGPVPVINGVLGYWDTVGAHIPDGIYTIRLRVVKADSNYDEYYVRNLHVVNSAPPTPVITPTDIAQPETPTPVPTGGTPSGTVVVTVEQPPTRAAASATPTRKPSARATASPLLDLGAISFDGMREQFCAGAWMAAGVFAIGGVYVFFRSSSSWLARRVRRMLYRRQHRNRQ